MDIAKAIHKALAVFGTVALLAVQIPYVNAQTFNDVPTDAWYFDYVEQMVDQGIVDAGDKFRPGDNLNRAELVKIVVTAIDGLAGYKAPATATFDDVAVDAWYYDYVEAAVQLDIVQGYTDASGALTGKFGPGDTVNRAAATKILVNAFSVPTTLEPAAPFSDVSASAWYYDYVATAYNQSIVDGYANGKFGPADPITRAQVAKLVVNAQNPTERDGGTVTPPPPDDGGTTPPPPPAAEGALEVSLNDATPASSTVPGSSSNVQVATIDFTAAEDAVVLSSLKITRGGVGKATDWDALYIYNGAKRLTTGRTLNSDTNTATFPISVTVDAGATVSLKLVADVNAAPGASNQHYFYLASAADVTSNAKSTAGDFPVVGNTFTMGGAATAVTSITLTTGSTPSQPRIGQTDAEISSLQLAAGAADDVALHSLTITQNGSLNASKLTNLKLLRGTDEVATVEAFDGDRATFVLATPYVIPKGQTKTFYIHADINGGRTTDTIEIYMDESTDIVAIDQQYGYGAHPTNTSYTVAGVTALTLQGGKVTIVDNGPASAQIAQNTTNVKLLNFSLTVDRDVTVRDMDFWLWAETTAGTTATRPNVGAAALGGTVATLAVNGAEQSLNSIIIDGTDSANVAAGDMIKLAATNGTTYYCAVTAAAALTLTTGCPTVAVSDNAVITTDNPYYYIKNVRIVDLDSGATLQGPVTRMSDNTKLNGTTLTTTTATTDSTYYKDFTEDYELVGGETRHLSVQADLDTNMPAAYALKARVGFSTTASYVKDFAANQFIATSDIVGGDLTSKAMTVRQNSLTVAKAATPTSQTFVKGEDNVPALGISLQSGDAGAVTVKKLIVRVYGDDDGTFTQGASSLGDTAANTYVSSVTLYDGNDVVAGPYSLTLVDADSGGFTAGTDYYKVTFDNLSYPVPKGQTKTLVAKAKLLNTMSATTYVAIDMLPSSDITSEDADANTVTPGMAAGATNLNLAATPNPLITVATSGSLSAYSEGNPDAAIVLAGSSDVLVAKYRFRALQEAFHVNKLTVMNDLTTTFGTAESTGAISKVTVKYTDADGVTQKASGALSGGSVALSGLDVYVPKGGDSFVEIYVDTVTRAAYGQGVSGLTYRLGIQETSNTSSTFEAVGASSSTTDNSGTFSNSTSVKTYTIRQSKPTFTKVASSTTLINGENTLYAVTVAADAAGPISFGRLVFDVTTSGLTTAGNDVNTFKFLRGSTQISSSDVNIYAKDSADARTQIELQAGAGLDALFLTTATAADGADGDGVSDATVKVIVSFDEEETVSAGTSKTYYLKANVTGALSTDNITTRIATSDEDTALTGLSSTTNTNNNSVSNDGRIQSTGAATSGIFSAAVTDFRQLVGSNRNVIWSDKSADSHAYATVASGSVTTDTGSFDWTNGNLLKVSELNAQTLTY
ncbi:S-layer homology domain-containing protein [Candidatus Peregrinibacteria bacterium]|nr:S-layer homology domain-containing protein [Candidatus Peregrinibacteria bacterium]